MINWWAPPIVILGTIFGAYGALYFKKASSNLTLKIHDILKNRNLILGVIFYGISTALYLIGVRGGDLSVIYPLVSTSYIWVCFLSIKYLKESMNQFKWAGILSIIIGVSIIGMAGV